MGGSVIVICKDIFILNSYEEIVGNAMVTGEGEMADV